MRVLQLGKFYPPDVGGIEAVTYDLTQGLNARGIRTDVLCAQGTARVSWNGDYVVMRVPTWGVVASTAICPALPSYLRDIMHSYDIIHVHLPNPMANLALRLSGYTGRVILHWHSDIIRQKQLLKLYGPLQAWLLARADAIIATSPPYIEASPALSVWREKVRVIPIGIDPAPLTVDTELLGRLKDRYHGRRIVFSLGRLAYYKGFQYLVDAAAGMPDDVTVLIGGGGELAGRLQERISASGLKDKVELVGKIPAAELGAYYQLADIFCLPSIARSEAFGVVLLEAMAFGRPIVASDIPGSGVPWVNSHGESGFNVPMGDAAALSEALTNLLADSALRQLMGESARRRFEEHFTANRMVEATLNLYYEVGSASR